MQIMKMPTFKLNLKTLFSLILFAGGFVLAVSSNENVATATATTTATTISSRSDQPTSINTTMLIEPPADSPDRISPDSLESIDLTELLPSEGPPMTTLADVDLVPKQASLFGKDAVDVGALQSMDCHLRNVDFCYAGLIGSAERLLPETDEQLEVRCDEIKAATGCMAIYNKRCQTFKVFGALSMFSSPSNEQQQRAALNNLELPPAIEEALMGTNGANGANQGNNQAASDRITLADLSSICEPSAKATKHNRLIRRRILQLAKCINQRIPMLRPCIEDLKTALQVFYEPTRSLPIKPTCCAVSRFRACSMKSLDNICGLTSFEQLESSLASSSGAGSMMKTINRVCRVDSTDRHESPYCLDILPPSGMKPPQLRRGGKASKLARALDLFSFSPAAQTQN